MANLAKYKVGDKVNTSSGNLEFLKDTGERNKSTGNIIGLWRCYCGKEFSTMNRNITKGNTQSCGCLAKKEIESRLIDPTLSYLYSLQGSIYQRCYNEKRNSFINYGGRGIKLQKDWINNGDKFVSDLLNKIGHRPTEKHQLDRINNDGDYEINNIQWVLSKENCRNRRNNIFVEINNEKKTLAEWAEISGLRYGLLLDRFGNGWTGEKLLSSPRKVTFTEGMSPHLWHNVKKRCSNKDNERYGGRGISLHPDWINNRKKFEADILQELGPKPSSRHQLDRINNDGNYEPGNLRWATYTENNRNTSFNVMLSIGEKTKTISEWEEITGISRGAIVRRLEEGWDKKDLFLSEDQRKMSEDVVGLIRQKYSEGYSMNALAREKNISRRAITDVVRNRGAYSKK